MPCSLQARPSLAVPGNVICGRLYLHGGSQQGHMAGFVDMVVVARATILDIAIPVFEAVIDSNGGF